MASPTAARTAARARAAARGDKNMIVQRIEQVGLALSARLRQPTVERHLLEALENARERRTLGERPPQHLNHLLDCLGTRFGVSGRMALADEKAHMPHDAVADLTESREMDKEPLLEHRRQWAVQVGRLRKPRLDPAVLLTPRLERCPRQLLVPKTFLLAPFASSGRQDAACRKRETRNFDQPAQVRPGLRQR